MPGEFTTEAVGMLAAGAIVATVAVPVGVLGWALSRKQPGPPLPAWKPWRVPWTGFEVFAAFAVIQLTIPAMLVQFGLVKGTHAAAAALPFQLGLLALAARLLYPAWNSVAPHFGRRLPRFVALAVLVWMVLTPVVLLFHAGVVNLFTALDMQPDEHPLAKFNNEAVLEQVLFLLQACLAAPLIEEILFRGMLLPWIVGGRARTTGLLANQPFTPTAARPWIVLAMGGLFAAASGKPGAMVFAGVLAGGMVVVWVAVRRGRRVVRGVYSSAALFALVHSAVWPSPIPLFLLGLGLGWLAVRTRGVLVPAVVHGLFNAVSAVFVLRGGTG